MPETPLVQSLVRACEILDCVAAAPQGARLAEIARQLDLKVPTVHNLIRSLVERGLVAKLDDGRYYLGPTIDRLAQQRNESRLLRAVEDAMRTLAADEPNALLNFSHPDGIEMVEARYWDPRVRVLQQRRGVGHHPYASASGLAWLAHADPAIRAEITLRYPFHEHGAHLWGTPEALEQFLGIVRETRVSHPSFPNSTLYLVAVPFLGRGGQFYGVIGAALPAPQVVDPATQARLIDHITRAVERATAAI